MKINFIDILIQSLKTSFLSILTPSLLKLWPLFGLLAAIFVFRVISYQIHHHKLRKSGFFDVKKLKGTQFEEYLEHFFSSQGYKVIRTGRSGDMGADLVLEKDLLRIVVQVKGQEGKVGPGAIQEAVASKAHYQASAAWAVTNSTYTKEAIQLAKENQVTLIDQEDFRKWLLETL